MTVEFDIYLDLADTLKGDEVILLPQRKTHQELLARQLSDYQVTLEQVKEENPNPEEWNSSKLAVLYTTNLLRVLLHEGQIKADQVLTLSQRLSPDDKSGLCMAYERVDSWCDLWDGPKLLRSCIQRPKIRSEQ